MVNFPVFADEFGGGALLSEGIATLNPRLFIRYAFTSFRTQPMANDDIDCDSCFARTVAGRPSLHSTASAHGVRGSRHSHRPKDAERGSVHSLHSYFTLLVLFGSFRGDCCLFEIIIIILFL